MRLLTVSRRTGDQHFTAANMHNSGELALLQGNVEQALTEMHQALLTLVEHSDVARSASALEGLANVALALGEPVRALRILGALDPLVSSTGLVSSDLDPTHLHDLRTQATTQLDTSQAAAAWAEGHQLTLPRLAEELTAWRESRE